MSALSDRSQERSHFAANKGLRSLIFEPIKIKDHRSHKLREPINNYVSSLIQESVKVSFWSQQRSQVSHMRANKDVSSPIWEPIKVLFLSQQRSKVSGLINYGNQ